MYKEGKPTNGTEISSNSTKEKKMAAIIKQYIYKMSVHGFVTDWSAVRGSMHGRFHYRLRFFVALRDALHTQLPTPIFPRLPAPPCCGMPSSRFRIPLVPEPLSLDWEPIPGGFHRMETPRKALIPWPFQERRLLQLHTHFLFWYPFAFLNRRGNCGRWHIGSHVSYPFRYYFSLVFYLFNPLI